MIESSIKENGVVIDIETDGLFPDVSRIYCIVCKELSNGKVTKFIGDDCYNKSFQNFYKERKDTLIFIGHNIINFDLRVLSKLIGYNHGSVSDGTFSHIDRVIDTLLLSQLSNPIRDGGNSLASWGDRLNYSKLESPSFSYLSAEMVEYCVNDVELTYKLFHHLMEDDNELAKFSNDSIRREHLFKYLINKQETNGFYFDIQLAMSLLASLMDKLIKIENEMQNIFPPTIVELKTKTKEIPFNPGSRKQIGERLMEMGWKPKDFTAKGNVIVNELVLESVDFYEARECKEYLLLQKRASHIKAWIKFCDPNTSRIYGKVRTLGTVSTRCSHNSPNVAQTPAVYSPFGRECRNCWTVSDKENYKLLGCDANSLELRVLAHYMKDEKYINELINGDIHSINQELAGLPTRDMAKTFIYALIYGAGPYKIAQILNKDLVIAKAVMDKFMGSVPSLEKLLTNVNECAIRNRKLRALDGRYLHVRKLPAALNVLIQGGGAIVCKEWLIQIMREIERRKLDARPVANIHDEIQFEVRDDQAEELGKITQESMKQTEKELKLICPLDSSYQVGVTWSDTH
jgi:DNA polymerase-1